MKALRVDVLLYMQPINFLWEKLKSLYFAFVDERF